MNKAYIIIISILLWGFSCTKENSTDIFDIPNETAKIIKTTVYEPIDNDGELICGKRIKHPLGENIGIVYFDQFDNILLENIVDDQDSIIRQVRTVYHTPEEHKKAIIYSKYSWDTDIEKEIFVRNSNGQLTEIRENHNSRKDQLSHTFQYDDKGRVIKEVYGNTTEIKTYNPSPEGTYVVNIQTFTKDEEDNPKSLTKEETIIVNKINNKILKRFSNEYQFGVITKKTEIKNNFDDNEQLVLQIEQIKQVSPEDLHVIPLGLSVEEAEEYREENIKNSSLSYTKENKYEWEYNQFGDCVKEISPIDKTRWLFEYNQFGDWIKCIIFKTTFENEILFDRGLIAGSRKIEVERPICIIERDITYLNN